MPRIRNLISSTSVYRSFDMLNSKDKKKISLIVLIQISTSIFDLLTITLMGAIGALTIQGIENQNTGRRVDILLNFLGLNNFTFQQQVIFLGLLSILLILMKTLISVYFTRRTFFYLSVKSAEISAKLMSKLLNQNLQELRKNTSQEVLYIVNDGIKNFFIGLIGSAIIILSDLAVLVIIFVGLFIIDIEITLFCLLYFALSGYFLHRLLNNRARIIGRESQKLTVHHNEKVIEALGSYRENYVHYRNWYYLDKIKQLKYQQSRLNAEINFQPYISKYVFDVLIGGGILGLTIYLFSSRSPSYAVATLSLFIAALTRIAPAVLRLQQNILVIKQINGQSEGTFNTISRIGLEENVNSNQLSIDFTYEDFNPLIKFNNVSFNYNSNSSFMLSKLDLLIKPESRIAIVGPSGSGKTTFVDLMLGLLEPQTGSIEVSGFRPSEAIAKWPGAISYVPQNLFFSAASIKENISMGYDLDLVDDDKIWAALKLAHADNFVRNLKLGINTQMGEQGANFSGGQKQRIAIARSLITQPKLIVFDEPTSALDAVSGLEITNTLLNLASSATLVIIAHQLHTLKMVDQIIYIENGKVLLFNSFEELKNSIPNFDENIFI
jgi:ABC-type multidrug transport system fused ATPase/permease subunit